MRRAFVLLVVASMSMQAGAPAAAAGGGQPPPRDRVATPAGSATVRGVVVDGDNGQGLRRATVTLDVFDRQARRTVTTSITSDADGRFEFVNVVAGTLHVRARLTGYYDVTDIDRPRSGAPPPSIRDGEVMAGVKVTLHRGSAIVGRITDEFGDPAAGVVVQVLRRRRGRSGDVTGVYRAGGSPVTDDTGAFRAWGLMPGEYLISAQPNRFESEPQGIDQTSRGGYAPTYFPGAVDSDSAGAVVVRAGRDTTGVAFSLLPAPLAKVRGTLLLPGGVEARGITLMVSRPDRNRGDSQASGRRVNDDASFEVSRLPPGTYRLTAEVWSPLEGRAALHGSTEVQVNGIDLEGVTVSVQTGSTLRGRVVTDTGEAVPAGVPITVRVDSASRSFEAPYARPVQAAADGTFTVRGAFGRRLVRATVASTSTVGVTQEAPAAAWLLKSVTRDGRDVTDVPIEFDGSDVEVEITMTSRPSVVTGAVSWNSAAAANDAPRPAVVVFADDPGRWQQPTRWVRVAPVTEEGRFEVRGLPPGERYLAVAVEGGVTPDLTSPESLEALRQAASPLRVDEGASHDVPLRAVPPPQP